MGAWGMTGPDTPVLRLHMTGRGEDSIRMEKRLRSAGRAIGADIQLEWGARGFDPLCVSVAGE